MMTVNLVDVENGLAIIERFLMDYDYSNRAIIMERLFRVCNECELPKSRGRS